MNNKPLGAWAASSSNPEDVSNRIKGVIVSLSAVIIFVAANFSNVTLTSADIVDIATQLSVIGGLIFSLYGAGVALVRWVASR